jgi:SAM-dependent methyltransferase
MSMSRDSNIDMRTVEGFGDEWTAFDQTALDPDEHRRMFQDYFDIFPLDELHRAEGFDLGCGSGRWALLVAPCVGRLHCIDPSAKALDVCRRRLQLLPNVEFHLAGAHEIPLPDNSQDFGYSLGVLHHIPNPELAMQQCVAKLRESAPFLVYLYYRFDDRPAWFRALWKGSEIGRRLVSRLPFKARRAVAEIIAAAVYLPLARFARTAERAGVDVSHWPLSHYRKYQYYIMRTDALDRFGTRLERRFSKAEIEAMMHRSGLTNVRFSNRPPFWIAVGRKGPICTVPAHDRLSGAQSQGFRHETGTTE